MQITMAVAHRGAAGPSAVSGHCGLLQSLDTDPPGAQRRPRAPQALLQSLDTAERAGPAATTRAAGLSAVSCSLWTLRREPAQRRPRAPQALLSSLDLLQSLDTAERAGPAATTRAAGPSAVSGHCGESRPSGDHAPSAVSGHCRPFCSLVSDGVSGVNE